MNLILIRSIRAYLKPSLTSIETVFHQGNGASRAKSRFFCTTASDLVQSETKESKTPRRKTYQRMASMKTLIKQREWMDQAATQLGVKTFSDWYKFSSENLLALQGASFMKRYYRGSLFLTLKAVYPDTPWKPWLFHARPRSMWRGTTVLNDFFEWIRCDILQFRFLEEWYAVKYDDLVARLKQHGVPVTILQHYCGGSMVNAIKEAYPTHEWLDWRFSKVPRGFWDTQDNRRRFFKWAEEQLDIKTMEDWYKIKLHDVAELGGGGMLQNQYGGSLLDALKDIYPDHNWSSINFGWASSKKKQRTEDTGDSDSVATS